MIVYNEKNYFIYIFYFIFINISKLHHKFRMKNNDVKIRNNLRKKKQYGWKKSINIDHL